MTTRMKDISGFGPIVIGEPKKRVCTASWWIDQPQAHFTKVCAQMTDARLLADDVSDREAQWWQQRAALLAMVNTSTRRSYVRSLHR